MLDVHALWHFRAFQQSDGKVLCFLLLFSWVEWCSEYVLVGFLWLSAFGCNSICKSCCKKLLNKFYSPSHTVPQLPGWGLMPCQVYRLAGPGATGSEKSTKESFCCVLFLFGSHAGVAALDLAWLDLPTLERRSIPGYSPERESHSQLPCRQYQAICFSLSVIDPG